MTWGVRAISCISQEFLEGVSMSTFGIAVGKALFGRSRGKLRKEHSYPPPGATPPDSPQQRPGAVGGLLNGGDSLGLRRRCSKACHDRL